jgi:hypothetical protein|tara:strand:- start:1213 stop:1737 length:525 start_codon:yes stop_codon:yes gene_type:complete
MPIEPCPYLPKASPHDHTTLGRHGARRDAAFYLDALSYGQSLWQQGHPGRALLAVTRALYANLEASEEILKTWPLPYSALHWIMAQHTSDNFPGNPRISFQHQATRLRGARSEVRSARAWAVWALACAARPNLLGDIEQGIIEPSLDDISKRLKTHGHPHEAALWQSTLEADEC